MAHDVWARRLAGEEGAEEEERPAVAVGEERVPKSAEAAEADADGDDVVQFQEEEDDVKVTDVAPAPKKRRLSPERNAPEIVVSDVIMKQEETTQPGRTF